jgi:hypothetical protein
VVEFTQKVNVESKEQKYRSGTISIMYDADDSLSKLEITNFEAYGANRTSILDEQIDDEPDFYKGILEFENISPYLAVLKEVSVKQKDKDAELIQLPELQENEKITIAPNTKWVSNEWKVDTQGEIPEYAKNASFILLPNLVAITSTAIDIEDVELAVAMLEAGIVYDIKEIKSFKQVPFNTTHTVSNAGEAKFDMLSIKQTIPKKFIPPKRDEIKMTLGGKKVDLDPAWIKIEPDDQDSSKEHILTIELDDLKSKEAIGPLEPGKDMIAEFPLIADMLTPEDKLLTNVTWMANTYPAGEPFVKTIAEEEGEGLVIPVNHSRLKLTRGKTIVATEDPSTYEVVLVLLNESNTDIVTYDLKDRVPEKFEYIVSDDAKPTSTDKHDGKEVLIWKLENIAQNDSREIRYKIKAKDDDSRASSAQFSM